jgi:sec-independent protein translocase protein TatA
MEGFGIDKLLLILVIVLVLFGARRVPEIGSSIGKGIREFKRGMQDIDKESENPPHLNDRDEAPLPPREPSPTTNSEPKRLLGH